MGIFPIGERFKVRHRASLGIAVVQEYWNTGLGTVSYTHLDVYKRQNAEYLYEHVMSIPLFYSMTDEDVESVITAIKKVLAYYRR